MPIGDTPRKLTQDSKACIQLAFERLGDVDRLVEWANAPGNLGTFYCQIWTKIVPKAVDASLTGKDGTPLLINIVKFGEEDTDDEPIEDAEYTELDRDTDGKEGVDAT